MEKNWQYAHLDNVFKLYLLLEKHLSGPFVGGGCRGWSSSTLVMTHE